MAAINTETITVTISRIQKNGQDLPRLVDKELIQTVESIVQELVGPGAVVEAVID